MYFVAKKLPITKLERFRAISSDELRPYHPVPVPVYMLLTRNSKFLAIKRALDFFSESEFQRIEGAQNLYYLDFIDDLKPVYEIAHKVRAELSWLTPKDSLALEPAPYELSERVLVELSKLWRLSDPRVSVSDQVLEVELYYTVILANELCKPLPMDRMLAARERDFERYELGLLRSGLATFLAMHVGVLDYSTLSRIRERVFLETVNLHALTAKIKLSPEISELVAWVSEMVTDSGVLVIKSNIVEHSVQRFSYKIRSRVLRMKEEGYHSNIELRSVSGVDGFLSESPKAKEDESAS